MSSARGEKRARAPGPRTRRQPIDRPVSHFPIPPDKFDPTKASDDQLLYFGLPPRPDDSATEVERFYWRSTFKGPLTVEPPQMQYMMSGFNTSEVPHSGHRLNLSLTSGRRQRSENWSGGYVTPAGGGTFTDVRSIWKVPDPKLPAGYEKDKEYRSSVWIGLDGQRRYLHSSLPQIGTAQFVADTTKDGVQSDCFCWWQWWFRNGYSKDVELPLEVHPGQWISAEVSVINRTLVKFFIMNIDEQRMYPVFQAWAPQSRYADVQGKVQVLVSGATAEWVTERPRAYAPQKPKSGNEEDAESGELYELPNYGDVEFTGCHAIARETPSSVDGRVHQLLGGRYINMYARQRGAERTKDISVARRLSDTSLRTSYRSP